MATIRQRRAGVNPSAETAEDKVYTEEDYALPEGAAEEWEQPGDAYGAAHWNETGLPDEAFAPDEEDEPEWQPDAAQGDYEPLFTGDSIDFSLSGEDPLDEALLSDEERSELRRSHWQLLSSLADFAGVILGTAAILVLVMLLVSLLNWLIGDMSQSFILLQKNL